MSDKNIRFWLTAAKEELNKAKGETVSDAICLNNAVTYIDENLKTI